jgi:polyphosphate kinase
MRRRFVEMIDREIDCHQRGNNGRIVAKMNQLEDPEIIRALYRASQAGVAIDLIVRGFCCLRPEVPGVSDNIRVISIIGRFLEHSRIYYFHNGGQEEFYIGSADWMSRNLDNRVEAVTPVESKELCGQLRRILEVCLSDNRLAWELQSDGHYLQRLPLESGREKNSQKYFARKAAKASLGAGLSVS